MGANGEKLSKQNGALALDLSDPMVCLNAAAQVLGLPTAIGTLPEAMHAWLRAWPHRDAT
jgi:glutamyl-Q tRNA(Asp) synthetase